MSDGAVPSLAWVISRRAMWSSRTRRGTNLRSKATPTSMIRRSSRCPSTGMKSGMRSMGIARYRTTAGGTARRGSGIRWSRARRNMRWNFCLSGKWAIRLRRLRVLSSARRKMSQLVTVRERVTPASPPPKAIQNSGVSTANSTAADEDRGAFLTRGRSCDLLPTRYLPALASARSFSPGRLAA